MGCEEYRASLELVASFEDDDASLQTTIAHIKDCSQCTDDFEAIRKLDNVIKEKMEEIETPAFLGSRIQANLRQHSAPAKTPQWQWAYVLGTFLFVSSLIFYNQIKIVSRLENLSGTIAQKSIQQPFAKTVSTLATESTGINTITAPAHLHPTHNALMKIIAAKAVTRHKSILASKFVVFEDNKVSDTFRKKFNFSFVLPNFSKELKLVGGSKCHSCLYEVGYLLYRQGRNSVSLCIFPATDFGLSEWQGRPETFKMDGHNVAIWKKQESVYALVFKLPVHEVRSLVWDLKEK